MTLDDMRKKIDDIDHRIIDLLAKRFSVVAKIDTYKKQHDISPLDMKRWRSLLYSLVRKAKQKGLSESLIIDIRERIHKESLSLQYIKKSA